MKVLIQAKRGAYRSGRFNQLPNRGEAEVVSPQFGLPGWVMDDDKTRRGGGAGNTVSGRSGDEEVRNSWLALHSAWRGGINDTADDNYSVWSKDLIQFLSLIPTITGGLSDPTVSSQ